jgi:putative DNA primase/helicase
MSAAESRQPTQWALVEVKWRDEYSEFSRGRKRCRHPGKPEPGRNHAQTVADSLLRHGVGSVKILDLPNLPPKGDVSDFFESGARSSH